MPLPTLAPYNATMHAVVGLTETLNANCVPYQQIWVRRCCARAGGHRRSGQFGDTRAAGAASTPDGAGGDAAWRDQPRGRGQAAHRRRRGRTGACHRRSRHRRSGAPAGRRAAGRSGLEQCGGAVGVDLDLGARDVLAHGGFGLRGSGSPRARVRRRACARQGRPSAACPSRLNGVVHDSTVPTPDHSTTAARVGSRSTADCTSSQRNSCVGGSVPYTPKLCLVRYPPLAVMRPALAGVGDQPLGHRGDRVRDVVVPRAAREGQAAGDRQRAVGSPSGSPSSLAATCTADGKHE